MLVLYPAFGRIATPYELTFRLTHHLQLAQPTFSLRTSNRNALNAQRKLA